MDAKYGMKVVELYKNNKLKEYKVEYLHGKMRPKEKDEIMHKFKVEK